MHAKTYEITFEGHAGTVLRSEFAGCAITEGPVTTTIRAELDQGALLGLMLSITGLGLELVHLQIAAPLHPE